jgi:hypothetical protein
VEAELTITSHGSQMTTLLQHFDDLVFVLREDFSEAICSFNEIMLRCARQPTINQLLRIVDLSTESKHLAGFLGDRNSVTRKHFDGDAKLLGFDDGLGSVFARWVEHGQEAAKMGNVNFNSTTTNIEKSENLG